MIRKLIYAVLFLIVISGQVSNAAPFAYITNGGSSNVSVIDTATNTVVASVPVGSIPGGVAVNPEGTKVYVANRGSGSVSVIDTSTNTVTATVNLGGTPSRVAVNPAGTRVYVTNGDNKNVSVIDTTTNTVIASVTIGNAPGGVAVNPAGTRVYVVSSDIDRGQGNFSVIDTATNTVIDTVVVDYGPSEVAVNPAGTRVYVTSSAGSYVVSVIDNSTNTVTATVNLGSSTSGVTVNPAGTLVYVVNSGTNRVSVINTTTNTITANVTVEGQPSGVAVNPAGTRIYVANTGSDTVSVINTTTNTVTATVTVGSSPKAIGQFIGPASAPVLTSIGVSPASKTLNATETQTFTASPKDQDGNDMTSDVTWSSSNTSVGTVDASGYFTAVAEGTTVVNATNASVVGSANVTVNPTVATSIDACGTISSPGEYTLTTSISNSGTSSCINITSSSVSFDGAGFTIDGVGTGGTYGVYVYNLTALTNVTVKNLRVTEWGSGIVYKNAKNGNITNDTANSNSDFGIYLGSSSNNNTLVNNTANSNTGNGISLVSSNYNTLTNSTANSNNYGIWLDSSDSNTLTNNTANSINDGIYFTNSNYNTLTNNTATSNNYGIWLEALSNSNTLTGNNASSNGDTGLYISSSGSNTLTGNIVNSNSNYGIWLIFSTSNTLTRNTVNSNTAYGIYITSSSDSSTIYNNDFNNSNNIGFSGVNSNTWNTTRTSGTNIKVGPYLGGNFWAYPNGTGFSQTCTDANDDGTCDSSYILDANNIDYLPLSLNFTSDTTAPASITNLTVGSTGQTYINWTWSDPSDSDFANISIYLNGVFKSNMSKGVLYYYAGGLSANTQYVLSTRTVDQTGNINQTWNNNTARTSASQTTTSSGGGGDYPPPTATATPAVTATATASVTATPPIPKLTVIKVSPSNASIVIDEKNTFTASTYDQFGNPITVPINWSSSNISVGTIDSAGVFKAAAPGNAIIMAKSGDVSGTTIVTVTPGMYRLWLATPRGFSDMSQEKGYKMSFNANPATSGFSKAERAYKISLSIYDSGVGGGYNENRYRLNLVPGQAHISYSNDITVNDPITLPAQSLLDYMSGRIGNLLTSLENYIKSIL